MTNSSRGNPWSLVVAGIAGLVAGVQTRSLIFGFVAALAMFIAQYIGSYRANARIKRKGIRNKDDQNQTRINGYLCAVVPVALVLLVIVRFVFN